MILTIVCQMTGYIKLQHINRQCRRMTTPMNANSTYAYNVFSLYVAGYVDDNIAGFDNASRPALNLTSGVRINGSGTPNAPFTLSLE